MIKVFRPGGKLLIFDGEGYGLYRRHTWSISTNKSSKTAYLFRRIQHNRKSVNIKFHRELIECPSNLQVDHVNGNGLDNRISNLRTKIAEIFPLG